MKNPVMAASGTVGFGREFGRFVDIALLGAVVTKAVTARPRPGNPPPRLWETPAGLLNSIGLQNPGIDAFVSEELPWLAAAGAPVIVNIAGDTVEEYEELAARLDARPEVAGIEANVSCPNVHAGGRAFAADPDSLWDVTATLRRATSKTLIVKLSPNTADIAEAARAAELGGADALSCVNTFLGAAVDIRTRMPVFARTFAGLSGPAIRPLALRMVWEAASAVKIPVIGTGGIFAASDALEHLLAGARACAIGTANLVSPSACLEVIEGIRAYLVEHGMGSVREIVGLAARR